MASQEDGCEGVVRQAQGRWARDGGEAGAALARSEQRMLLVAHLRGDEFLGAAGFRLETPGGRGKGTEAGRTRMCSVGWGNVFSFRPDVFTFRANVFSFEGLVFSEERGEQ